MQPRIILRRLLQLIHTLSDILIQPRLISDYTHTHVIFGRSFQTGLHIIAQKPHQGIYLVTRPAPVFRAERIDRQILYPHPVSFLTDHLHRLCPLYVSVVSGHPLLLCPSAVSVQNDRHMIRNLHIFFHDNPPDLSVTLGKGTTEYTSHIFCKPLSIRFP